MLNSFLIIVVLGFAIFSLKRWQKLPDEQRSKFTKQVVLWAVAIVVLALVVTGKAHWLMGVLATLLALAGRVAQFAQYLPLFKQVFGKKRDNSHSTSNVPAQHVMSRQDAADILGLDINASAEDIRMTHKKLMQKIHPDRGGSDALAKQINEAKKVLMTNLA